MSNKNIWTVECVTYNVNTKKPDDEQIRQLLTNDEIEAATIIVFGLQELPHSELFGTVPVESTWLEALCSWMNGVGKCLLCKTTLAWNLLLVFTSFELFPMVKKIDGRQSRSSLGGLTGHKGTVSLRILLKCDRSLVFVTSHFLPHVEKYAQRCEQYEYSKMCAFDDVESKRYVVWLGDLNWRVDSLTAPELIKKLSESNSDEEMDALVNRFDQLRKAQRNCEAFSEYFEKSIHFPPTYRLMVGSSYYDQERVPSWCDRILFKGIGVKCDLYQSNRMITLSDHFPVHAQLRFSSMPKADEFTWNVSFEYIPTWRTVIPLTSRFTYTGEFWNKNGSYRDWIGVYPADMPNVLRPITWLYVIACYNKYIAGRYETVAEFPSLNAGSYRVGYFSVNSNCLQGLSDEFRVDPAQ